MKCDYCGENIKMDCNWRQGRCPHIPPMINPHSFRFYNLLQTIKGWFKNGNST
jgi:hypothetical protein